MALLIHLCAHSLCFLCVLLLCCVVLCSLNGRLVVDGVLVSSYGSSGELVGHTAHSLHRALYRVHPALVQSLSWPVRVVESIATSAWHSTFKHLVAAVAPQLLS